MAYFHNVYLVPLLLLVALAPKLYGIDVTYETINATPARPIRYRSSSESWDELIDMYIVVVSAGQQPVQGLPAFPAQADVGQAPPLWVLIRGDNGYLIGFTNWTGHYHLFQGPDQNLIPEATILDTGLRYEDLLGRGGRKLLPNLPLSQDLFVGDSHTLGTFPASSADEMKKSVARYVVMVLEASRLKPIRQKISENWGLGIFYLDDMESKYTVHWALLSLQVLCDDQGIELTGADAKQLRSRINVENAEGGRNILGLVLRTRRFDPNDPQKIGSCRPASKVSPLSRK